MIKVGALNIGIPILCETVREESSGKWIAVGIFTDGIRFAELPGVAPVAVMVPFEHDADGEKDYKVRWITPAGATVGELGLQFEFDEAGRGLFFTPTFNMFVEQAGEIGFEFRAGGGDWVRIMTRPVEVEKDNSRLN